MNQVRDSAYYFEQAERCLRWARLLNDKRSIADLETMAEEYLDKARRLQSLERPSFRERVASE